MTKKAAKSKLVKILDRIRVLWGRVQNRFTVTKKRAEEVLKTSLPRFIKNTVHKGIDLVSEEIAGMRLVRVKIAAFLYLCVFSGLFLLVASYDHTDFVQKLIHPDNGTEIIIGVSSVLLALLLPVAILIIEDSKDNSLLRRTVVKNIIPLGKLPIVASLISLSLFIPEQQIIASQNITLRTLGGAVAGTCFVYIVMMLIKSYRWLSDGSEAVGGLPNPPSKDDPNFDYPNQFVSYRFAQIVRFLNNTTSHEAWTQLWSRWWTPMYDDALHKAFFKRQKENLRKEHKKKDNLVTNELVAYRYNISKRILEDYPYSITYLGEFLEIYELMHDGKKLSPKSKNLYAANNATAAIIREIIKENTNDEKVFFVATTIEKYVSRRYGLSADQGKLVRDPVLTQFVTELFSAVLKGDVSYHELQSSLNEYGKHWGVSHETIFKNPQTIAITMVNAFWGWFKTALKDIDPEKTNFGMGDVLKFVFPTSDTITLGYLYWYLCVSENIFDDTEGLEKFMTTPMPFMLMSNTEAEFVPAGSENDSLERFRTQLKKQADEAVSLFANLYVNYLLRTRNLDNLIAACEELANTKANKRQADYIRHLSAILEEIRNYYRLQKILPASKKK